MAKKKTTRKTTAADRSEETTFSEEDFNKGGKINPDPVEADSSADREPQIVKPAEDTRFETKGKSEDRQTGNVVPPAEVWRKVVSNNK